MLARNAKQGIIWGGLLILVGALLLVETVTDLSPWIWAALLIASAVIATAFYLVDRSDWAMLVTAYALWAIGLLIVLLTLNILDGGFIAFYVLVAIAIPFLAVYLRDRTLWWALIPAYVLTIIAVMVLLIEQGILDDLLIPAYVLIGIAIPFFVVYARDRRLWWALIPGAILALIGLSFLVAGAKAEFIGALLLVLVGVVVLARAFIRRGSAVDAGPPDSGLPPVTGPESEPQGEDYGE